MTLMYNQHQTLAGKDLPERKLAIIKLQILSKKICFLKFILEGYDGLAILSTVDSHQGLVEVRCPAEVQNEVCQLLDELHHNIT